MAKITVNFEVTILPELAIELSEKVKTLVDNFVKEMKPNPELYDINEDDKTFVCKQGYGLVGVDFEISFITHPDRDDIHYVMKKEFQALEAKHDKSETKVMPNGVICMHHFPKDSDVCRLCGYVIDDLAAI